MKFKCGLTREEEQAKEEKRVAANLKFLEEGEVFFAWLPIAVAKGDCRWLEKIRRFPVKFILPSHCRRYQDSAEDENAYIAQHMIRVVSWKYEAVKP